MMTAARSTTVGTPRAEQDLADLVARPQVRWRASSSGRRVEAAEVDDPPHAGALGGRGEGRGRLAVACPRSRGRAERVDEVVGDVDAVERARRASPAPSVALDASTWSIHGPATAARRAGQAAHPVAGGEQLGHQPAADVAGGAGHQAPSSSHVWGARPGRVARRRAALTARRRERPGLVHCRRGGRSKVLTDHGHANAALSRRA